jgi:hypothetical protein
MIAENASAPGGQKRLRFLTLIAARQAGAQSTHRRKSGR